MRLGLSHREEGALFSIDQEYLAAIVPVPQQVILILPWKEKDLVARRARVGQSYRRHPAARFFVASSSE